MTDDVESQIISAKETERHRKTKEDLLKLNSRFTAGGATGALGYFRREK